MVVGSKRHTERHSTMKKFKPDRAGAVSPCYAFKMGTLGTCDAHSGAIT
jgi:hypothetical protein